jgi:phytanoyl-CoA hydroxylase
LHERNDRMALDGQQIAQFHREGYLALAGVFSDADLQPVIDEITDEIDRRAREAT